MTTTRRRGGRPPLSPAPVDRTLVERTLPLPDLLLVQTITCVGLAVAFLLDEPGWWGAACGFGAGLLLVMPVAGRSSVRWALARVDFWRDRRRRRAIAHWAPFDHEQSDGTTVGLSWDGETLTSLIRVDQAPPALHVLSPGGAVSGPTVPVGVLADCLRTFDVALQSIDVISHGRRATGHGHVAAVYDSVLGSLPAVAHRSAWVVVRLDPTRCPDAVLARGGGWDGALRAATVATQRVTNRLRDTGLTASTTTASDMVNAVAELAGGVSLDALEETWAACRSRRMQLRSYGIDPASCTAEGLASLWTLPSGSTTVALSLRREEQRDGVELRGIVRMDSLGGGRSVHPGVHRLPGRQFDALMCALPFPTPRRPVGQWLAARGRDGVPPLAGLELPVAGCGQVVGADEHGRAIALPLFGPRVARVELHGTLHLAQQVVLRSLALGARVRVHTRRTGAWREMVEAVGDVTQLQVVGGNRDVAEAAAQQSVSVEVYDGQPERPVLMGTTTIVVGPTRSTPTTAADVRLQLLDEDRDEVLVTTRTGSATVTMVASDEEMRYIGASFDVTDDHDQPARDWPRTQERQ